jgi:hypothetical protein
MPRHLIRPSGRNGSSSIEMINEAVTWATSTAAVNGLAEADSAYAKVAGAGCGSTEAVTLARDD